MRSEGIKPQDVLVLLKLLAMEEQPWRQLDLALELGISQSEMVHSLRRLRGCGLLDETKRKPRRLASLEFLVHALKYLVPVEPGAVSRGIPTAHSASPLSKKIVSEEQLVWPHESGKIRGISLRPIYPSAPGAAERDPKLHELLALADALRIGRAREQNLAEAELRKRLIKSEA